VEHNARQTSSKKWVADAGTSLMRRKAVRYCCAIARTSAEKIIGVNLRSSASY
jgi:hypothetical protein